MRKAFDVILATGLVHLHPPKHHARATRILDDVLARDPGHVSALMARAYILQHTKNWSGAAKHFQRVITETDTDDSHGWVHARAREEVAWCLAMDGNIEGSLNGLREVSMVLEAGDAPSEDRARVEWRIGKCMWDLGGQCLSYFCSQFLICYPDSRTVAGRIIQAFHHFAEAEP